MTDSPSLVFRARRAVVDGRVRSAAIQVRDGIITAIDDLDASLDGREIELAGDEVLLPGLVDSHVHVNEPGRTEWEGFATATGAAAAGGVTTIVDMPLNSLPPTLTRAALQAKQEAAQGQCRVDVAFWGGAVPANLVDLPELLAAGVVGVKCFLLDSGVPEFPPLDPEQLFEAAEIVAAAGGLLAVHAEDGGLLAAAPPPAGRSYAAFVASRPAKAEATAIAVVVDVARQTGCRVHIVHVSSAAGAEVVRRAKADGVSITAETCPHYLTLRSVDIPDGNPAFKCCPPVRGEPDREALWAALADGTIDIVVTDHSPATPEVKGLAHGDLGSAWGGIASLQFGFAAVWAEAVRRGVSLATVVSWMATGPADLVGLSDKGRITVGAAADLVVLADRESFVVTPHLIVHRHPITPYLGTTLLGVVRDVWLSGVELPSEPPRGRLLVSA